MSKSMLHRRPLRRGSLYLAVLGTTVVVSLLAVAGMHAARVQLAATTTGADQYQAKLLASSAIEHALAAFNSDANWRSTYAVDVDYPATPVTANGGTFAWQLKSAGALNRKLQGTGSCGDATCTLEVELAQPPDLDCALLVGGDLTIDSDCTLTAEYAPVGVNGAITNNGAVVADLEAQSISGSGSITGAQSAPAAQRVLPNPAYVFDYYERIGTPLKPAKIGNAVITLTVLSPNAAWTGTTNPHGIYVIDTQGADLVISTCRIVGTLVVTNLAPGKKVVVSGYVNWEPAYPNYPALLVDGDVSIETNDDGVSEWFLTPSFNPVGTPYQGQEDGDKSDDFAESVAGLVYCTGNLDIDGKTSSDRVPDLRGTFIAGGNCTIRDRMFPIIKYDDAAALSPPPGFAVDSSVVIVPGSWRQVSGD